MDESPAPASQPPRPAPARRGRRRALRLALLLLLPPLLAFYAFEAGVRAIPPDAVQITTTPYGLSYGMIGHGPTTTQMVTDPLKVALLHAAITAHPTSDPVFDPFGAICNGGFYTDALYRFTWHGIPIEVVRSAGGSCGSLIVESSSGGLPDLFLYQWQWQP